MGTGQLVRNTKGIKNYVGVVKELLGDDQVRVLFSTSGHDKLSDVSVDDVKKINVTDEFINLFVELNQ